MKNHMKYIAMEHFVNLPEDEITPSRIWYFINNYQWAFEEYTFIILGRSRPTGKTWLYNKLRDMNFNAVEISEDVYNSISYNDDKNHISVSKFEKSIVIILNKPLTRIGEEK